MHVPDGFLDAPTSVATGVVAAAGVALALRGARRELDDRTAPDGRPGRDLRLRRPDDELPGRRRHQRPPARRRAGRRAGRARGPPRCASASCCSSRRLFMADGGITALGTNITLMALVGVGVGWLVFRAVQPVLPKRLGVVAPAAAIARAGQRPGRRAGVHRCCSRSAAPPRSTPAPCHRDGRLAHPDRHRRGGDHRPGGRQRRRRPPRPRATAPAASCGDARARDPDARSA